MTKKDYVKFAEMLAELYLRAKDENDLKDYEIVEQMITDVLQDDNERFDITRFIDYITKLVYQKKAVSSSIAEK